MTPAGTSTTNAGTKPRNPREVYLFGVPIGNLGWFQTMLIGTAAGFAAFFAGTFLGILGIAIANGAGHAAFSFANAYRWIGLPLGLAVLVPSLSFLITLRLRRLARG